MGFCCYRCFLLSDFFLHHFYLFQHLCRVILLAQIRVELLRIRKRRVFDRKNDSVSDIKAVAERPVPETQYRMFRAVFIKRMHGKRLSCSFRRFTYLFLCLKALYVVKCVLRIGTVRETVRIGEYIFGFSLKTQEKVGVRIMPA